MNWLKTFAFGWNHGQMEKKHVNSWYNQCVQTIILTSQILATSKYIVDGCTQFDATNLV